MGPLKGFIVIELAGIGPAPFAGMLLSDMGATVIRVDRREQADLGVPGRTPKFDILGRGRQSISVDLKSADGIAVVKRLAAKADALIEGFRPGVIERLGLGPDVLSAANPKLVIGRMTGTPSMSRLAGPPLPTWSTPAAAYSRANWRTVASPSLA